MRFIFFIFSFLALFSLEAFAIVVEAPRELNDKKGFSGEVDASLSAARGNTDSTESDFSGALYYDSNKTMSTMIVNYTYGESSGAAYANKLYVHLRSVYPLQGMTHISKEYFAQYNRDTFRSLQEREFAGAGMRYKVAGKDDNRFYAGIGVMGVREKETGTRLDTFAAVPMYINHILTWGDGKTLTSSLSYQPHMTDLGDFRALGSVSLEVPLVSTISLTCSVNMEHDSKPPVKIKKTDVGTNFELKYSF